MLADDCKDLQGRGCIIEGCSYAYIYLKHVKGKNGNNKKQNGIKIKTNTKPMHRLNDCHNNIKSNLT